MTGTRTAYFYEKVRGNHYDRRKKRVLEFLLLTPFFFIIIAIMAVLTWFIPAGAYETAKGGGVISGTYKTVASNPQGFFDILMAPVRAC